MADFFSGRLGSLWLGILAVAVGYFILAKLSFQIADASKTVLPIWPPVGYSQGLLILTGATLAPGVTLGSLLTTMTAGDQSSQRYIRCRQQYPPAPAGAVAAVPGSVCTHAAADQRRGGAIALGALVPATLSATLGVTYFCLTAELSWAGYSGA